ncbi:hypothetical protein PVAND_006202 [Polypedilum vanderplanki]|uniref:PDZ domain-containing protein n=1 Tax=Polypedilum vanderplanki TaxID=319348 RepID=A0A9J6C2F7_POLVA|nr:hypothetical protein PVAND_006202 [Polypedilum vanderplanki]
MPRVTFKIEKQPPMTTTTGNQASDNLEVFHGIGNTLGFDLTGGIDFSMPITIFHKPGSLNKGIYEWPPKKTQTVRISRQEPPAPPPSEDSSVKEGSRADNAGLKLGDSIVTINNVDTTNMTLQEANNVLEQASQQDVKLGVIKFDEVDESKPEKKPTIHEILLKGKRANPRLPFENQLNLPREAYIEKAEKKSWHPIVWPHPERIQTDMLATQKELPHKRVIRNLRRLLTEIADKPEERSAHIENLLLILPRGSADPLKVVRPKPEKKEGEEEDEEAEEEVVQKKEEEIEETATEDEEEEEEEEE